MPKYIFFTGGVASSIGKGVAAAALGTVLKASKLNVTIAKLDPYINVDPGTMNPIQHGEVFVTSDGAETDLDLGHYERFLEINMQRKNNCTSGQIYDQVIKRERAGDYLGSTVQVIPHITDEIKKFIANVANGDTDVVIIEIGGTVGDIESLPFIEAIRQFRLELPPQGACFIHMTLVPRVSAAGEIKTKPTQHSVRELREIGIQPDCLLCRSEGNLPKEHRDKIALFANLHAEAVFGVPDVELIYSLPVKLAQMKVTDHIAGLLNLKLPKPKLADWQKFTRRATKAKNKVTVGFVGKYGNPNESYKSLVEALRHAGIHTGNDVCFEHLDLNELAAGNDDGSFAKCDAVLVPGAFGTRGTEGKIAAITRAREAGKPYLGICIGMQLALIEFARSQLGLAQANSTEFAPKTPHPIVQLEQAQSGSELGGTMRLGAETCIIKQGTKLHKIYAKTKISERHRHRYEFNNDYSEQFAAAGMIISARSVTGNYCEAIELTKHPFFVATQFHPEYESSPRQSHPLFINFIKAAAKAQGRT